MPSRPEELVAALTAEILDSFEKLEALVYVAEAEHPVTNEELQARLGLSRQATLDTLNALAQDGVLEQRAGTFSVASGGPWGRHVAALVAMHRSDRMQVAVLMSQAALKRLRSTAARAFAEAFVIDSKKDKGDG